MGFARLRQILIAALAATVPLCVGAAVGLLLTSSGGGSSSVRSLTLQPNDLPPEFVLTDEKLYSRDELMAKLPAESQIAEAGVQEATHVSYELQGDVPMVIDVFVYAYEDEGTAEAAHAFLREPDPDELRPLDLGGEFSGHAFLDSLVVEGIGEGAFLMSGYVDYDDGDEDTVGESLPVRIYFMRSGTARAEVLVAGESIFLTPDRVARNQYLRLERPDAVVAP